MSGITPNLQASGKTYYFKLYPTENATFDVIKSVPAAGEIHVIIQLRQEQEPIMLIIP